MRPKSLVLLALALGCGLVASIGISQVMDRNNRSPGTIETVPIYVAKHNINPGDSVSPEMLSLQEWPKDKVPRGAISNLEEIEGRRPRSAIIEGEPILDAKLLALGQVSDPIRAITKGMRLKTIAVDAETSAAGLLGPGDRVDVQLFVRRDDRIGIETSKSKIILQNIRVFAVDQTVQRSPDGGDERTIAKTVSLMLTPEQASKLALAEQIGSISLIPRNPDDEAAADWSEYTVDDLLADGETGSRAKEQGRDVTDDKSADGDLLAAVAAAAPPGKPPFRMEIVEAQAVREVLFDSDTGRPLRPVSNKAVGGPAVSPSPSPGVVGAGSDPSPTEIEIDESDTSPEGFPIDFDAPN